MRNGADHARIRPDSANFGPKSATAKSYPKSPSAKDDGIAAAAKYLTKKRRIGTIFRSCQEPEYPETTGKRNAIMGVTRRNGMPMRLR